MGNIVKMNNYKNVIIPDNLLFHNGKPRNNNDIGDAISTIYKAGGFGDEWGFSIMLDHGDGSVERVNVEQHEGVREPMDIVMAFFKLKVNHPEDTKNMYLCVCGQIKTKKELKMPKSARMLGRCKV